MAFKAAPLPHEWMITSIIGFFIALLFVYGDLGHQGSGLDAAFRKWGIAFMLICILMFIASIISMTMASTSDEDLEPLAIHYHRR
jgi:hypothetical protein